MQQFSEAFVECVRAATKEVAESRPGFANQADETMTLAIATVLGGERKFLRRMAGRPAHMKEFVGRDREKTYAVVLTSHGVSQATAAKVVAEAILHAAKG